MEHERLRAEPDAELLQQHPPAVQLLSKHLPDETSGLKTDQAGEGLVHLREKRNSCAFLSFQVKKYSD